MEVEVCLGARKRLERRLVSCQKGGFSALARTADYHCRSAIILLKAGALDFPLLTESFQSSLSRAEASGLQEPSRR
jgi:hypothetical protein